MVDFLMSVGICVMLAMLSLISFNDNHILLSILLGAPPAVMSLYALYVAAGIKYSQRKSGWFPGESITSLQSTAIIEAEIKGRRRIKTDSVQNIKSTFKSGDILRVRKQTVLDKLFG